MNERPGKDYSLGTGGCFSVSGVWGEPGGQFSWAKGFSGLIFDEQVWELGSDGADGWPVDIWGEPGSGTVGRGVGIGNGRGER